MASKRDVSKEQNERHKRILKVMLKKEENRFCADCNSRGPTWASTNLGVFVCLQCSGIHRSLGVHISVVRSTNLDTWLPEQIAFIQRMDNVKANSYWEANLPRDFRRPKDTEQSKLERFIQEKYVSQNFRDRDMPPPTIKNFNDHPLTAADNSSPLPTPAPTSSSSSLASPQTAAAAPRPAPSAAAAAAKPEPPVQMMADLLSLDDDPPAPPPPTPVAPQVVSENGNGWAEFASAGDNSSDPFGSPAPPPSSAVTSAQPPADPFAQPASEAPSGNTAQAQNSESNDPFSAFATAQPNTGESGAAVEAQTSKPASNKLSNDDILALFDAAPAANSFGYPPVGQQPSGYGGYGMQPGIPTPQQQQQQYAVQNGNGYFVQPGGMHGQGYAQMTPQQQAYMMQQQQQQQHAYMMKQQQQYGVGASSAGYQQGGFMQQHAGYGMPGQQPGMQWGYNQFSQPAAAAVAVPQPAAQQHFAEFASFQ